MTIEPETPSPVGGRPGPSERFFRGHRLPMSPAEALAAFGNCMTEYEQKEIKGYKNIWFLGLDAMKIHGSRNTRNNNHGFDNDRYFYQQVTWDHIGYRYEVLDVLGKGVYGQVLKCFDHQNNEFVALKVLRSKIGNELGKEEVRILKHLLHKDPEEDHHVVRMKDNFVFRSHICISFELLGSDMDAMVTGKGESVSYVKECAYSILKCLQLLKREKIMHSDLKLANIVMSDKDPETLKVIDFGVSMVQDQPRYYGRIQSQYIRAPEVILGLLCTNAIDMWSFGCCVIKLLIGRAPFSGGDEIKQLTHTIEILGMPPAEIVASSLWKDVFFDEQGMLKYIRLDKSGEDILPGSKRLESLLGSSDPDLLDFIQRCLHWDSSKRMTPDQALKHAWMKETSLECARLPQNKGMSSSPGNTAKTGMLKTLAGTTTMGRGQLPPMHLKPNKATVSLQQTMDQGEMAKLGKHGRILRPLILETTSKVPSIGAAAPAPPPRGKRTTVTTDGGAAKSDKGASRPAGRPVYSLLPYIGAAAPAPPPRGKRSTGTIDGGAAKSDAGTTRPAGRAVYSLLPPIGAAAPALPPSGKRTTGTTDGGAAKSDKGASRPAGRPVYSLLPYVGAAAPAPLPRGKRSTGTIDGGAAKSDTGTTRPAGQAGYSQVPPISTGSPAPPSRPKSKRAANTTDGGEANRDEGTSRPKGRRGFFLVPLISTASPAPPSRHERATNTTDGGATNRDDGTSRPAGRAVYSLLPSIGATAPAPPPRGKRATSTTDGGAAMSNEGASRPAGRPVYSLLPSIGATAPAPPPRGKRSTGTIDGGAAKSDAGTMRPAGQAGYSQVPPISTGSPAPPSRRKSNMATNTTDGGAANRDEGTSRPAGRRGFCLVPLISTASSAPLSRHERATNTTDSGATNRDEGKSRPAGRGETQTQYVPSWTERNC